MRCFRVPFLFSLLGAGLMTSAFASSNPVSYTTVSVLPSTTEVGISYPIEYQFTNHLPYTIPSLTLQTITNYSGTLSVESNSCSSSIASGASCTWHADFTPTQAVSDETIGLRLSYLGTNYTLPANQTDAAVATASRLGSGLTNEATYILARYNNKLFAGTDTGVYENNLSSPTAWSLFGSNITSRVLSLAVNGQTLYCGPLQTTGVYEHSVSSSSGNWQQFGSGTSQFIFTYLLPHQGVLYGGTFANSVWSASLSSSSPTWELVGTNTLSSSLYSLAISGTKIYAGNLGSYQNDLTTPAHWQQVGENFAPTTSGQLIVNNTLISASTAGINSHSITDLTGDWTSYGTGLGQQHAYSLVLFNDETILAGTANGVYSTSVESPGVWHQLASLSTVRSLLVYNSVIYAATEDGVYKITS